MMNAIIANLPLILSTMFGGGVVTFLWWWWSDDPDSDDPLDFDAWQSENEPWVPKFDTVADDEIPERMVF